MESVLRKTQTDQGALLETEVKIMMVITIMVMMMMIAIMVTIELIIMMAMRMITANMTMHCNGDEIIMHQAEDGMTTTLLHPHQTSSIALKIQQVF